MMHEAMTMGGVALALNVGLVPRARRAAVSRHDACYCYYRAAAKYLGFSRGQLLHRRERNVLYPSGLSPRGLIRHNT